MVSPRPRKGRRHERLHQGHRAGDRPHAPVEPAGAAHLPALDDGLLDARRGRPHRQPHADDRRRLGRHRDRVLCDLHGPRTGSQRGLWPGGAAARADAASGVSAAARPRPRPVGRRLPRWHENCYLRAGSWWREGALARPEDVVLDGSSLDLERVAAVARERAPVRIAEAAWQRIHQGHENLRALVEAGHPIYGLTTGFGALDGCAVGPDKVRALQHNLLKSHAAGIGPAMAPDAVRAMMVIRLNVLATGLTGVAPATVAALLAMLERDVVPEVPERGSVGACGDLAPLAHMALPLIGLGRASVGGGPVEPGAAAMARANIALPDIAGRDGIALINGTEQTTGIGVLALLDAQALVRQAEVVAASSLEALGAVDDAFATATALAKPHPGQVATSLRLQALTQGSTAVLPPRPGRLRDALSLRCIPQVLGSVRDGLAHAEAVLTIEINAANDNPLFGLADGFVTSNSGNFHGQAAADALDAAANAITSLAVIAERRCARLVDPHHNGGLAAFLIHPEAALGENSGFMIAQYTAAALVAELRMRAVPAGIQSITTCAGTEDHVPMAPLAARRLRFAVDTGRSVVAIEALLAAQARDLKGVPPAPALASLHAAIRREVPVMVEDRPLGEDIAAVTRLLAGLPDPFAGAMPTFDHVDPSSNLGEPE
ncbi:MAG: aromatic amino acid lyase [Geminicoccaceae bacterium]|nr:MAG: aromatic amino acid lyase [Geminicoccaceae bacterium]